jgi:PAS domain S-box-containing protein
MNLDDSVESLKAQIANLESELNQKNQAVVQLERNVRELNQKVQTATENAQPTAELSELEETLKRLMIRIAMIVQGGKCLFMIHDPETRELYAGKPALGFEDGQLDDFRLGEGEGASGVCYSSSKSVILYDTETDIREDSKAFAKIGVRNGISVPLIVEKRDEETNAVVDRKVIGVIWVFNKKFGGVFIDEDVQLLDRMSRNAAAVINTASTFRKVVEEKEQLHEMTDALTAGLVMIGRNGRVLQMNSSARRIFGLAPTESLGVRTYDQLVKDDIVRSVLVKALADETDIQEEVTITDAEDASRTFQIQSTVVRNENGDMVGTAAIFSDITELKNIDKLKTAFVSTVSHELRTPMTSIKGFISTLLMDEDGTMFQHTDRLEFYGIVDKECDRLKRLIDDLLNVSRIEAGASMLPNFEDVELHELVKKAIMIDNGSTYKKDNHTLNFDIASDVPEIIEADGDKFEQILHNLVGNSLKYSPDGGPVHLQVSMKDENTVQFAISDKGLGMTPEFLQKFGQKFARADNRDNRSINGTGIGAFLVKNFVEVHNGDMWAESEGLGKGTTAYFTLPIKQPEDDGSNASLSSRVAG